MVSALLQICCPLSIIGGGVAELACELVSPTTRREIACQDLAQPTREKILKQNIFSLDKQNFMRCYVAVGQHHIKKQPRFLGTVSKILVITLLSRYNIENRIKTGDNDYKKGLWCNKKYNKLYFKEAIKNG